MPRKKLNPSVQSQGEFAFYAPAVPAPATLATLEPATAEALAGDLVECLDGIGAEAPAASLAGQLADELGMLEAEMANMSVHEKQLKARLAGLLGGQGQCEGQVFRATVSTYDKSCTDWRAVAEAVGYSAQLKTAHTTKRPQTTVKVVARKAHP